MAYLYILQSEVNERYYIGSTIDLDRRLKEHNEGKTTSTRLTRPFKVVFVQEYETIQEARNMEYRLKKKKSRLIIEKIITTDKITIK